MTLVRDALVLDPERTALPNDGVAQVVEPSTDADFDVLRWELKSFVCRGEFERGLDRILSSYLTNLGEPRQPAVWISGFYGSGKSHLARVLQFIWRDYQLPDGARASSLVNVPSDIAIHLQELATAGRRNGGLWAAAGKLQSSKGSVRLRLLQLVLKSAGLPQQLPAGKFVLWLHKENLYEAVRQRVEAAGRSLASELTNLYVSPVLAEALLAAHPEIAASEAEVHALLRQQYPNVPDVDNDEMVEILDQVFRHRSTDPSKLPCLLVILDELQQFVGDRSDMLGDIQETVETCSAGFEGRLLFVATGQSALPAHQLLSKLKDRFTVQVELRDSDRNAVIREVVLRKKPDREADVKAMLEQCSGEIDRHLAGSRLQAAADDSSTLVSDYPLLPTRRRFWDAVLRGVDAAGSGAQLRTQLRVAFEGTRSINDRALGAVIPGDYLFQQQSAEMLRTGALLREIDNLVQSLVDGTADGELRSRLCALIFLISKVHPDEGLKATPEVLADLLVDDLVAGSTLLRQQIPGQLDRLVELGHLLQVGDEYRLQTKEGAEWEAEYKRVYAAVLGDDVRLDVERRQVLRAAVEETFKGLSFTQGVAKAPRGFELCFSDEQPSTDGPKVPVWVRDGWSVGSAAVRSEAQALGMDSPMVLVFLPRKDDDRLRRELASALAARETLDARRTTAGSAEGEDARAAMETRRRHAERDRIALVQGILQEATVLQGGGTDVREGGLRDSVEAAVRAAVERLYPQFSAGDDAKWSDVLRRARDGSTDALRVVGHGQEPAQHPVCKQILDYLGTQGRTGNDLRKHFEAPPYGWPRDALSGALAVMTAVGFVKATEHGVAVPVQDLDNTRVGKTTFQREGDVVSTTQRIHVRKLLQTAGVAYKEGQEAVALPEVIRQLRDLAAAAGGDAPAPPPPETGHLHELSQRTGNALILGCSEQRDQLLAELAEWQQRADKLRLRRDRWRRLEQLLRHARHLPVHDEVAPQVEAIEAHRRLLAEPDPVPPLCEQLTTALRAELQAVWQRHDQVVSAELAAIEQSSDWQRLDPSQREQIKAEHDLRAVPAADLGDEPKLLAALDAAGLEQWATRVTAVPQHAKVARLDAAKALEPQAQSFSPPQTTLKTADDVEAYLAEMRTELLAQIARGPVVIS